MRDTTSTSYVRRLAFVDEYERRGCEKYILDSFQHLEHVQNRFSRASHVVLDEAFQKMLHDVLGVEDGFLEVLLHFLSSKSSGDEEGNMATQHISVSKRTYRRFISLVVQRLAFARQQAKFRHLFEAFDEDGSGSIDRDELDHLNDTKGFRFSFQELEILSSRSNASGELDCEGFATGLYLVFITRKLKKIMEAKRERDETIVAAFNHRATDSGGGVHTISWHDFRAVIFELGLPLSSRVVNDTIHAAGGTWTEIESVIMDHSFPSDSKALSKTLLFLERGLWFWLVVLPAVSLVLYRYYSQDRDGIFNLIVVFVIQLEVFLRVVCYVRLGRSLRQFLLWNEHNAIDLLDAVVDFTFYSCRAIFGILSTSRSTIGTVHLLRLCRLLPAVRKLIPVDRIVMAFARLISIDMRNSPRFAIFRRIISACWGVGPRFDFPTFRRIISALAKHEKRLEAWPMPYYYRGFNEFENGSGAMKVADLEVLFHDIGLGIPTPFELLQMVNQRGGARRAAEPGSGFGKAPDREALLYFEDFCDILTFVHDESVECAHINYFCQHRHRAERTLQFIKSNVLTVAASTLVSFTTEVLSFATNLYVLAASTTDDLEELELKLSGYAEACRISMEAMPWALQVFGGVIAYLLREGFLMLCTLGSYFQFDFESVAGQGVSCEGVQSLLYLPIIYFIVATVIVLFDSGVYSFVKVAPSDYEHVTAVSFTGTCFTYSMPALNVYFLTLLFPPTNIWGTFSRPCKDNTA